MAVTLWVKRVDNGNFQNGDVVDMAEGVGLFHGHKPTQSGDWRIIVVDDAVPKQIYALDLFKSYKHPATDKPILQRVAHIDMSGLEAHAARMAGRALANDDSIRTGMMQVEAYTKRKFLPPIPGLLT